MADQKKAKQRGPAGEKPQPEGQRFTHLLASKPPHERKAAAAAMFTSGVVHGIIIIFAIWGTLQMAKAEQDREQISIIVLPEEPPPPPPPPPTPEAQPPPEANVVRGFQVLVLPDIIPPEIPPASVFETIEADFTGEGREGGRASGAAADTAIEAQPRFTPFTVAPELKNRLEVQRALVDLYPPMLRDAGIGGRVLVWCLIDEEGRVIRTKIQETSGYPQFDQAALTVAETMRFTPALNMDRRVKVWVALPIDFNVM
jgi:protein TonB